MTSEERSDAWYLRSQGRRFGPLSEDELRGYFRAGMVKQGDLVGMPGQPEMKSAAEVAEMLGESAPAPGPASAYSPAVTGIPGAAAAAAVGPLTPPGTAFSSLPHILLTPAPRRSLGWAVPVVAILALLGLLYFGLSMLRQIEAQKTPLPAGAGAGTLRPPTPEASVVTADGSTVDGFPAPTSIDSTASAPAVSTAVASADWFPKADGLSRAGDWAALASHSQLWSEAEPRRDEPWLFMGLANSRLGRNAEAIAALKHVLAGTPTHATARTLLADAYLQDRQYQEAVPLLQALVQSQPNDARQWNNLGNALIALDRYDESVAALETAVRVEPGFQEAWLNLANVYQRGGFPDKAAAARANAGPAR